MAFQRNITTTTHAALQTKLAANAADINTIYRITDAVGSTKVIDVIASTVSALYGNAENLTDSTFGVYDIGADTFTAQGGSGAAWGTITGTLSDQTDLQSALDGKAANNGAVFTNLQEITNEIKYASIDRSPADRDGDDLLTVDATFINLTGWSGEDLTGITSLGNTSGGFGEIIYFLAGGAVNIVVGDPDVPANSRFLGGANFALEAGSVYMVVFDQTSGGWQVGLVARPVATTPGIINISREDFITLAGTYSTTSLYRITDATPGAILLDPAANNANSPDFTFSVVTNETALLQGAYYLGTTGNTDDVFFPAPNLRQLRLELTSAEIGSATSIDIPGLDGTTDYFWDATDVRIANTFATTPYTNTLYIQSQGAADPQWSDGGVLQAVSSQFKGMTDLKSAPAADDVFADGGKLRVTKSGADVGGGDGTVVLFITAQLVKTIA